MVPMESKSSRFPHVTKIRLTQENLEKIEKIKGLVDISTNKIINALISRTSENNIVEFLFLEGYK